MFVLGCLPPHEHVCICLCICVYVPECIVCACKHTSIHVCAWVRAWGHMCESVHPSIHLFVCLSMCMFVLPNVCSHMRAFISDCAIFLTSNFLHITSNFLLLTSMFVLGCLHPYEHVSVCIYLIASCVHVIMLAFMCVREHVREGVCVSLSVSLFIQPSVCLSVCPHACLCIQMFVCTCVRSSMHVWHFFFLTSNVLLLTSSFLRPTSNFLLLTSNFHVCTWVFATVRTCVRMSTRPCICTWVHRVCV